MHEALAKGDMGLAVAALAPGAVATTMSLFGTDEQQSTYLPAFTGDEVPAAALAIAEPTPAVRPGRAGHQAEEKGDGYVLNGVKSGVRPWLRGRAVRGGRAQLDGKPQLFMRRVEGTDGITIESDPSMGLRAASLSRLVLEDVAVEKIALLGDADDHREVVRLLPARLVRPGRRHRAGGARLRDAVREGTHGLR